MKNYYHHQGDFIPCHYSEKLIGKLSRLNATVNKTVDIDRIEKAIYIARKYHGEQMRESGEPYYSHPIEVAHKVSDYLFDTDIIVISILHDTLEDTELTYEMIEDIFGKYVATSVMDLTRVKKNGKITAGECVNILFKEKKYDVLFIKLIDRWHNLQTLECKSQEKIKKTIVETLTHFLPLAIFFEKLDIEQELCQPMLRLLELKRDGNSNQTARDNTGLRTTFPTGYPKYYLQPLRIL